MIPVHVNIPELSVAPLGRPLCQLLQVNDDESRLIELFQSSGSVPPVFFSKGPESLDDGEFSSKFIRNVKIWPKWVGFAQSGTNRDLWHCFFSFWDR